MDDLSLLIIKYLEEQKTKIADIRNPLNIETDNEIEVRKAMMQMFDGMIRKLNKTENKVQDNWK